MNVLVTQAAEGLPRRRFTVADCFRLVETGIIGMEERFELIGGEIVPMSPKEICHEKLKQWLNVKLARNIPDQYHFAQQTTFRMAEDTFIEPDFVVYPAGGLETLGPESALLVIEISVSSLAYDMGRKAALCAAHGIREYWVIDAETLDVHVHKSPSSGQYSDVMTLCRDAVLAPGLVDGFEISLSEFK